MSLTDRENPYRIDSDINIDSRVDRVEKITPTAHTLLGACHL